MSSYISSCFMRSLALCYLKLHFFQQASLPHGAERTRKNRSARKRPYYTPFSRAKKHETRGKCKSKTPKSPSFSLVLLHRLAMLRSTKPLSRVFHHAPLENGENRSDLSKAEFEVVKIGHFDPNFEPKIYIGFLFIHQLPHHWYIQPSNDATFSVVRTGR